MNVLQVRNKMVVEEEQRKKFEEGIDQDANLLQMQLHDDVSFYYYKYIYIYIYTLCVCLYCWFFNQ